MTRKTLPKKLSDCLELALKDLAQVERMKRTYTVSMYRWHEPNGKDRIAGRGRHSRVRGRRPGVGRW